MEDETKRQMITFDARAMESLRWLAQQRGIDEDPDGHWIAQILRHGLATDTALLEHVCGGGKVELVDADGTRCAVDMELPVKPPLPIRLCRRPLSQCDEQGDDQ